MRILVTLFVVALTIVVATAAAPNPNELDWAGLEALFTKANFTETNYIGHQGGMEYKDMTRKGGYLVGLDLVITRFEKSNDVVRGFTPVFLTKTGRFLGGTHGAHNGVKLVHLIAKPGYGVGQITGQFDGIALRRIKIRFDHLKGLGLDPNDSYESDWIGDYPGLKDATIDTKGALAIGVTGCSGKGVGGMKLIILK
jgi:hypothetical protein